MHDWEWGPEEVEASKWDLEAEEEYVEYKMKHCICEVDEDCACLTLEQFKDAKIKKLQAYWDWREEETEQDYA